MCLTLLHPISERFNSEERRRWECLSIEACCNNSPFLAKRRLTIKRNKG